MYTNDCIYPRTTIPIMCKMCVQKLPMTTFPSYFLVYIAYCQHTIILNYTLFTKNILISFDYALCNFINFTFLITSSIKNWSGKQLSLLFSLLLGFFPYLCFPVSILSKVYVHCDQSHPLCLAELFVHPWVLPAAPSSVKWGLLGHTLSKLYKFNFLRQESTIFSQNLTFSKKIYHFKRKYTISNKK